MILSETSTKEEIADFAKKLEEATAFKLTMQLGASKSAFLSNPYVFPTPAYIAVYLGRQTFATFPINTPLDAIVTCWKTHNSGKAEGLRLGRDELTKQLRCLLQIPSIEQRTYGD